MDLEYENALLAFKTQVFYNNYRRGQFQKSVSPEERAQSIACQKAELQEMKQNFCDFKEKFDLAVSSEERGEMFDRIFNRFLQRQVRILVLQKSHITFCKITLFRKKFLPTFAAFGQMRTSRVKKKRRRRKVLQRQRWSHHHPPKRRE